MKRIIFTIITAVVCASMATPVMAAETSQNDIHKGVYETATHAYEKTEEKYNDKGMTARFVENSCVGDPRKQHMQNPIIVSSTTQRNPATGKLERFTHYKCRWCGRDEFTITTE